MLWLFGLFPGVIHGWFIILKRHPDQSHSETIPSNRPSNVERKYVIDSATIPEPMPATDARGSRDGTEVRPFPSPAVHVGGVLAGGANDTGGYAFEQHASHGQLPTYESVAGGSSDSPVKSVRTDSKQRS